MPYNENIPQAIDIIANSQNDLLLNFQSLLAFLNVNHDTTTFTSPAMANQGKHKFVNFPIQTANPDVNGFLSLVSGTSALSGDTQLFLQTSSGITFEITNGVNAANGYFRLMSGILIKWTIDTISAADTAETTLVRPFPVAANIPAFERVLWGTVVPLTDSADPTRDINVYASLVTFTRLTFTIDQFIRAISGTKQGPYRLAALFIGT